MIKTFAFASDLKTRELIRVYDVRVYEIKLTVVDHSATIDEEHHLGKPLSYFDGRSCVDYSPVANREYLHDLLYEADLLVDVREAASLYRWNLSFIDDEDKAFDAAIETATRSKIQRIADEWKIPLNTQAPKPIGPELADPIKDAALDDLPITLPVKFFSRSNILIAAQEYFDGSNKKHSRNFTYEIVPQSEDRLLLSVTDLARPDRWVKFAIEDLGLTPVKMNPEIVEPRKVDPMDKLHSKIKEMYRSHNNPSLASFVDQDTTNRASVAQIAALSYELDNIAPADVAKVHQGELVNRRKWVYVGEQSPWRLRHGETIEEYKHRLNSRISLNRDDAIEALAPLADKILVTEHEHWQSSHADAIYQAAVWAADKIKAREQGSTDGDAPNNGRKGIIEEMDAQTLDEYISSTKMSIGQIGERMALSQSEEEILKVKQDFVHLNENLFLAQSRQEEITA